MRSEAIKQAREERYRREEKESLEHKGDIAQIKRLWKYLSPRKGMIAWAVFLSILIALLAPVPMILVQYAIDNFIMEGLIGGVVLMAGLLLLTRLIHFAIERYTWVLIAEIGQYSMRDLRLDIFNHIQRQSLRFFDRNPVGRLITRITSDVNVLNELFAQGVVGIFQQVFSLVVIVAVLFWYNWYLALWAMTILPLVLLASWNFRNNVFYTYRLTRVRLSRMNTFFQENITGMRTVQANTREKPQAEIFDRLNDMHRDAHIKTVLQYAIFFPLIEIVFAVGVAIVLWKGGLQYIAAGDEMTAMGTAVTVGQLALFVQALERFFQPVKDLSEKYNVVQAAFAASERLFVLLDTPAAINDPETPVEVGPFSREIEFRDVWFAYNEGEWVLKGVSFIVKPGETVAIVGPTGSGKSTLMSLLCRFYDIQKGAILIDGVDIREMRQADLRAKIAIVLQDVFLFYGTVAENVRMGRTDITDEKIRSVCEETGFAPFVARLPKGYESGVKERGATLSTGQKQLLSFARALAYDPEILVLDEATANIDTESEQQLQRAVARLCAGRTSLVIAHRLSTIQRAHKILVIHRGYLAEEGTHGELLAKDGLYRRLYNLQYKEEAAG
ncbi:MAG: ABC transporter ATP-binding protein [Candidatus Sumerlaeia bacterium]|nr:ABC transporter ATP-binding protein [Candidatus Sumerlaeia bacterium]